MSLNEHLFVNLRHARPMIPAWRNDSKHHCPEEASMGSPFANTTNGKRRAIS